VGKLRKQKINILIVDDHAMIRTAICDLLEKSGKFEIFSAVNGFEALAYADENELDLVLMDIIMPEKDGIETTRELTKKYPGIKVLVLTGSYDKEDVFRMLEAGASGYILKEADQKELELAIDKVLRDEYYFGSKPMEAIIHDIKEIILPRKTSAKGELSHLTPREIEIIRYIAKGMVNKQIASKLFISKRTVDKHRTNILQKLHVNNSAELIACAVKCGIVE
jgi:two-component system response regulator NreC